MGEKIRRQLDLEWCAKNGTVPAGEETDEKGVPLGIEITKEQIKYIQEQRALQERNSNRPS